jgi:N-ethylmaleimide reductase
MLASALLFQSTFVSGHTVRHRIVMAPMTRGRSAQPGDVPSAMTARYYAQRASAAFIVTEPAQISAQAKGCSRTPGIHTDRQVAAWKLVTDAVHAAGGKVFLQLRHAGRLSHPDFHDGDLPVAPSAIPFSGHVWKIDSLRPQGGFVDCPTPRALSRAEISGVVRDFARSARNAVTAGFDGVEIHAASGYLVDQFLCTTSNHRLDEYGGSRENRLRFLKDVVVAVTAAAGADRTAVRFAPFLSQKAMACPDILPTLLEAIAFLQSRRIAYLHLAEADVFEALPFGDDYREEVRRRFFGPIVVAGNYDLPRAEWVLARGYADLVAFGRAFISNPDLPYRLQNGLPLAPVDASTLLGGDEQGYTTYQEFRRT